MFLILSANNGYLRFPLSIIKSLRILGGDFGGDAAAGAEVADDGHTSRFTACRQIVQNIIGQVLVKDAFVAVTLEIKLERFKLDAELVGAIRDMDRAEIRLAGLGAKAGEFRTIDLDIIVLLRMRIIKGF